MDANMKPRHFWLAALLMSTPWTSIAVAALPTEGRMPPLTRATAWLNSQPLDAQALRGKVVLVDFWTYTCINWRRTLPYLRAWAAKYRDDGLVVIGVHTPEFDFEKDLDNVRSQAQAQAVDYPIAVDSDYSLWNAFSNQYWPALYFVDAHGYIRHHQFGEGDYDRLEGIIQQLLREAGHTDFEPRFVAVAGHGAEAEADWRNLRSPETYVGSEQRENFARRAASLKLNEWTLAGDWQTRSDSAVLTKPNGRIVYRFHARDLHLVMGPATRGASVRFRVTIDGQPPGASHGVDIDAAGFGTLDQQRMYQLIRQAAPIEDRQFEIEFLDAGAEVFSFTFG
jgi:thiol-disulfide isomerase/thioredoxin